MLENSLFSSDTPMCHCCSPDNRPHPLSSRTCCPQSAGFCHPHPVRRSRICKIEWSQIKNLIMLLDFLENYLAKVSVYYLRCPPKVAPPYLYRSSSSSSLSEPLNYEKYSLITMIKTRAVFKVFILKIKIEGSL